MNPPDPAAEYEEPVADLYRIQDRLTPAEQAALRELIDGYGNI